MDIKLLRTFVTLAQQGRLHAGFLRANRLRPAISCPQG